jgi:hypothetical protein
MVLSSVTEQHYFEKALGTKNDAAQAQTGIFRIQ